MGQAPGWLHVFHDVKNLQTACFRAALVCIREYMRSKPNSHLIRNCNFKFTCERTWDSLSELIDKPLAEGIVRYCDKCLENVYLVRSADALLLHIELDHCVAVPVEITNMFSAHESLANPLVGVVKLK